MSNFATYCNVARSPQEPTGKRYKSLRYAAERYCSLTHTSFQSVFHELEVRWGLKVGATNSNEVLIAAATDLESARRSFLVRLNALSARRRDEKRGGGRFPRADWAAKLSSAIALGRSRSGSPPTMPVAECVVATQHAATPPEFSLGASVVVLLNARNRTQRHGTVERREWHFKLGRWFYLLREDSRRISKRYFAEDLALRTES